MLSLPPSTLRLAVLFALISAHMTHVRLTNTAVPAPYLDEVFHIPQAQAYWAGEWKRWDDKITTPPGLYLWSYAFSAVRRVTALDPGAMLGVDELRFSNAVLIYVLLITLYVWAAVVGRRARGAGDDDGPERETVLPREMVIVAFPLLSFFSVLYYTDLFSAWTVVAALVAWEVSRQSRGWGSFWFQIVHVVLGLLSLASRQTNVFWVALFLGGLQVVDVVRNLKAMGVGGLLRDVDMGEASVEDIFHLVRQLVPTALTHLPTVVLSLWPHLTLLASFGAFVVWNGGVVLGDKSNHIATIHLPQLLYIWPCMVFFSWPVLLPQLSSIHHFRQQLPRPWLALFIMGLMAAAVYFNTIVHPFTLADNRHYVFYVFRILMRRWWIKYAAVPVYFACACLVLGALGPRQRGAGEDSSVRLSFALVWFASTALSLVSAPLVEPRYFIVPWLVWRMYVPDVSETPVADVGGGKKATTTTTGSLIQRTIQVLSSYSLWLELAWYLAVNSMTSWVFLHHGFGWTQEPGVTQRFMW